MNDSFSRSDYQWMARALALAAEGMNTTAPNPRVGCVIVRDDKIVGEGFHQRAGEAHAEVIALTAAGEMARGATAYVSLEPCSHHGRTPPCAESLIDAGVARVVAAMRDPNPLVAGGGLAMLELAGVMTQCGLMEKEAEDLNRGFISRMTRGRPWVRVKIAMSLDGKTALPNGESKWITGPSARRDVHRLRARSCAILTGIGTVLADDPMLTVRDMEVSRQPLRVLVDSALRLRPDATLVASGGPVLVVSTEDADPERARALEDRGVEVLRCPALGGRVDLEALLNELGRREINEITVEAGATLNGALLAAGLVDEIILYCAPVLLGDKARSTFELPELANMAERRTLKVADVRKVGGDWRIVARPA